MAISTTTVTIAAVLSIACGGLLLHPNTPWTGSASAAQQVSPARRERLYQLEKESRLDELSALAQEILESRDIEDRAAAYTTLFRAFLTHDRLAELIPIFQKAVQKHPADANACKMLGQVYRLQGDMAEAIAMYEKAVQLSPEDHAAYQQLGAFYSSHGLYKKAISAYKRAISMEPGGKQVYYMGPRSYTQLADVYIATGQRDEAISMYKERLDAWPIDRTLYKQLADLYNRFGMEKDARTFALELRERGGNSAHLHTLVGDFYAAIGDQNEFIRSYEKAVELTPRRRYLQILRGAYEQAGKSDLAAQVQERIKTPSIPAGTGSIRGTVTDIDSPAYSPVINARVKYSGMNQEGEVMTDEVGEYEIAGLPAGEYLVSVNKAGLRANVNYVTVTAGGEAYHDVNMSGKKPEPMVGTGEDTWGSSFAILQISSSGEMSIEGRTMPTLDDWEGFLTINGRRIRTLIVKAHKDTPCGTVIDAMRRAVRVEATRFGRRTPLLMSFRISMLREEPAPIIEVRLLPGQAIKSGGRIMTRAPEPEMPEDTLLAYSFVPSEVSIMWIANPEAPERLGVMELNHKAVDMTRLLHRLQSAPAEWRRALLLQFEPDVRYEQIYQVAQLAERAGAEYIGVGLGSRGIIRKKIAVTAKVPLRRKTPQVTERSPAQDTYEAGAALVPMGTNLETGKANAPKAIPYFKEVIEKFPNTDYADLSYVQLGMCYEYLERWEHAEKAYGELVQKYTDENGDPVTPSSNNVVQAVRFARLRKDKIKAYRLSLEKKQ